MIALTRRAYPPFAFVGAECKRYAGDKNPQKMEVHDLDNEKWECKIDKLWHAEVVMFDNLEKALKDGFRRCAHCLPAAKA